MPIQKESASTDCSDNLRETGSESVGIALCLRRNAHATPIPKGFAFATKRGLSFAATLRPDAPRHGFEITDIHVAVARLNPTEKASW
jgi:hypothetical protein